MGMQPPIAALAVFRSISPVSGTEEGIVQASVSTDHGSWGVQWHEAHLVVLSQVQGPLTREDAVMAAYTKHVFSAGLDCLGRVYFFFFSHSLSQKGEELSL